MALYARVENGVAVELIDTGDYAITQLYAPSFVEMMVRVPDGADVELGAPLGDLRQAAAPAAAPPSPLATRANVAVDDEPAAQARAWRESVLSATQWLMTRHRDEQELGRVPSLPAAQYLELLQFRQALRDWPASTDFPAAVGRPAVPQWLASAAG
ncbi:phage tail assembly chaperone [Pseudomonas sp. NPDC089534]|uniref:phage tail assembly chaperone n=1 Tax=Pseudomonas sp. NPDC089534 TaxID=3364468 RepID=UPI003828C58F